MTAAIDSIDTLRAPLQCASLNLGVRGHVRALRAATCRRTPKVSHQQPCPVKAAHYPARLAGSMT
jgi:hypothetical protein